MIILDTPVIIYDALDPDRLSEKAIQRIGQADSANELVISDVSIWEISILIKNQQLKIDDSSSNFIHLYYEYRSPDIISIKPEIAELAESLEEPFHTDPFDRIIAATSIVMGATIITNDEQLLQSHIVQTLW